VSAFISHGLDFSLPQARMCPFFSLFVFVRSLQASSDPGEGRRKLVQPNLGNWARLQSLTSAAGGFVCLFVCFVLFCFVLFFTIFEYSTILEKSFQITVTTALGVQESLRHVYIETLLWLHHRWIVIDTETMLKISSGEM